MKKVLILAAVALCTAPAAAADTGQCDAKPFTLNKPADSAKKPIDEPKSAHVAPATARPAAKPPTKPRPPLLAGCKDGKTKKG